MVAGIVTMINLGFWQLGRLDQRRDFNATVEARYDTTPVPLDTILEPTSSDPDEPALDDLEWRPVTVTGSYFAGTSIQIANRGQPGRTGAAVGWVLAMRYSIGTRRAARARALAPAASTE